MQPSTAPRPAEPAGVLTTLKHDVLASIVVFLVALPLCMGIAMASGMPPTAGILTGIVGGILVGMISGAPLQVSGPAAGLTVVVYGLVKDFGPEMLGVIVLLGGLFQMVAGLLRLGQWFRAVSPAVIHGMLAGIGVVILASQFHVMIDDQPRDTPLQNIQTIPEAIYKVIYFNDHDYPHEIAAFIGLLTIAVLVLWKPLAPAKLRLLPAPLVAIALAMAVSASLKFNWDMWVKHVNMPDNLFDEVRLPTVELLRRATEMPVLIGAATIALIASAETLLCASAVDQLHTGPRTKYDRELFAQGVGNSICGAIGGLPMTGVIVRSAANVEAGGKTRLSAILHGIWLLVLVWFLPHILELIPTSSLAAVLVYTGYRLVNPHHIRDLWHAGKSELAIYLATLITIVSTDLLKGVLVGIALALVKLLYTFSHLNVRLEEDVANQRSVLYLEGAATFIRLPKLAATLEDVPPNAELHVHFEGLTYIDHACLDLLVSWEKQHEATGGSLIIDWDSLTARFRQPGSNGNSNGVNGNGHAAPARETVMK